MAVTLIIWRFLGLYFCAYQCIVASVEVCVACFLSLLDVISFNVLRSKRDRVVVYCCLRGDRTAFILVIRALLTLT